MKRLLAQSAVLIVYFFLLCCNERNRETSSTSKNKMVGGGCDGCELMYIGMPLQIDSIDIGPGWNEKGQKLIITGTVFQLDGKTPASNVIIYYWQTDNSGYYSPTAGMDERAKRHGHIRGWVKTSTNGSYTIQTIRPAPYPNKAIPAHIHLSIKEPGIATEYYPDEINFDDDKLLLPHFEKYPQQNRGGSGVVRVLLKDSLQIAEHNIILGLNVPNYPKTLAKGNGSGLPIGEDQPSFTPFHAWGPDKGTRTCPVCKYGRYHGIIYFVGNHPDWKAIKSWLQFLEQESVKRQNYLKVYFVYGNETSYSREGRQKQLERLGAELNIQNTALTFVPSFLDKETEVRLNKIDSKVGNTFIIYKHGNIVDKYVDLKPTPQSFKTVFESLDKTQGTYFNLPEPNYN